MGACHQLVLHQPRTGNLGAALLLHDNVSLIVCDARLRQS